MNKVEKYLLNQIEKKDEEIKVLHQIIDRIQNIETEYAKKTRFIHIVSAKAEIKSFESDGKIKEYIDLGDINNYGSDQPDFNFVVELLGINKYECYECCDCEACFENGMMSDKEE